MKKKKKLLKYISFFLTNDVKRLPIFMSVITLNIALSSGSMCFGFFLTSFSVLFAFVWVM